MKITKAVFPVAGLGTRFLPATKAIPKEMLPVLDKPLMQYAVAEAYDAGVREIVVITHASKNAIADHFYPDLELERELAEKQKHGLIETIKAIAPSDLKFSFVRQNRALGLGHAVGLARPWIGNEPFAVLLPDDLIRSEVGCISAMAKDFEKHHSSVVAVEEVPMTEVHKYGVVDSEAIALEQTRSITGIVEKPQQTEAPSNLAVVGRYILTPAIFDKLATITRGAGNELQLTDAIRELMSDEEVFAHRFAGTRFDCGSKGGLVKATIVHALADPELKEDIAEFLSEMTI